MLKEREEKILNYMKQEIKLKGYPPTVREICAALGIKSTSTAHKDIASLVKQGYIKKDPSKPRALMVVDESFADSIAAGGANASENGSNLSNLPSNADNTYGYDAKVEEIPVIGRIAAGTPILAEQNVEDSIPVPSRFLGNGRNFMLPSVAEACKPEMFG